jgi:putative SOS response-associated peptidase YedK
MRLPGGDGSRQIDYAEPMCGRAKMEGDFSELRAPFRLAPEHPLPNFQSTWNLAPTDPIPIVRRDPGDGLRRLDVVRWGLLPFWAKDAKLSYSTFNARSEDIDTKPAFRNAFNDRRCLVVLDAFYEWKQVGPREKQPYAIALADGSRMAMAGLWETWRTPGTEERVLSATIVTCPPNPLLAELHNRMPVILPAAGWPAWLGETTTRPSELKALLAPYPADQMTMWPVSKAVGSVKNNDPSLIEPLPH